MNAVVLVASAARAPLGQTPPPWLSDALLAISPSPSISSWGSATVSSRRSASPAPAGARGSAGSIGARARRAPFAFALTLLAAIRRASASRYSFSPTCNTAEGGTPTCRGGAACWASAGPRVEDLVERGVPRAARDRGRLRAGDLGLASDQRRRLPDARARREKEGRLSSLLVVAALGDRGRAAGRGGLVALALGRVRQPLVAAAAGDLGRRASLELGGACLSRAVSRRCGRVRGAPLRSIASPSCAPGSRTASSSGRVRCMGRLGRRPMPEWWSSGTRWARW